MDFLTTLIPVFVVIAGSMVAGFWAFLNRRGTERANRNNMRPPTWDEVWQRQDRQEKRIEQLEKAIERRDKTIEKRDRAFGRILSAIAVQWPPDAPGPVFDPQDIEDLGGDTIPAAWAGRFRNPPSKGATS